MHLLKKTFLFTIILAVLLSVQPIYAEIQPKPSVIPCGSTDLPCIQQSTQEEGGARIREYITDTFGVRLLNMFLGIAAVASVIFIIVGGLQMHLAMGNEEAVGKAKKTLIWAIAGLLISILSVAIVRIVTSISFTPNPPAR